MRVALIIGFGLLVLSVAAVGQGSGDAVETMPGFRQEAVAQQRALERRFDNRLNAQRNGNDCYIQDMVQRGADENVSDENGTISLTCAISRRHQTADQKSPLRHPAEVSAQNDDLGPELIGAAEDRNLVLLKKLLAAGADVHSHDYLGTTALIAATALPNNDACIQILLDHGSDVNAVSRAYGYGTPMMNAARRGDTALLRLLHAHGADPNRGNVFSAALFEAVAHHHRAAAALLLSYGADPNDDGDRNSSYKASILDKAIENGSKQMVTLLLQHKAAVNSDWQDPLGVAAGTGRIDLVRLLLRHGAKVNGHPYPVPVLACAGSIAVTKLLIAVGANVNSSGSRGITALMYAAESGKLGKVRLLLRSGARINEADVYGKNALFHAIEHPKVVDVLLAAGANPNVSVTAIDDGARYPTGTTPLMAAIEAGEHSVVRKLLKYGAHPVRKSVGK